MDLLQYRQQKGLCAQNTVSKKSHFSTQTLSTVLLRICFQELTFMCSFHLFYLVLQDSTLIGPPVTDVFPRTLPASRALQPLQGRLPMHKSVPVTVYKAPKTDGRKTADEAGRADMLLLCMLYSFMKTSRPFLLRSLQTSFLTSSNMFV